MTDVYKRQMLKGLEKRKHNLEAKLEKVEHAIKSRTDDVVDFKQMGIDHIFIDESHQFKNLTFNTRHDRVAVSYTHLYLMLRQKTYYKESDVQKFLSEHIDEFTKDQIAAYKARIR